MTLDILKVGYIYITLMLNITGISELESLLVTVLQKICLITSTKILNMLYDLKDTITCLLNVYCINMAENIS